MTCRSKHLEGMLKGLTFQLATGEKEGFDALLENLAKSTNRSSILLLFLCCSVPPYFGKVKLSMPSRFMRDFGDSFGHESAVKGLIKSGLNDLAKKQGRLNTVIDGVHGRTQAKQFFRCGCTQVPHEAGIIFTLSLHDGCFPVRAIMRKQSSLLPGRLRSA